MRLLLFFFSALNFRYFTLAAAEYRLVRCEVKRNSSGRTELAIHFQPGWPTISECFSYPTQNLTRCDSAAISLISFASCLERYVFTKS